MANSVDPEQMPHSAASDLDLISRVITARFFFFFFFVFLSSEKGTLQHIQIGVNMNDV